MNKTDEYALDAHTLLWFLEGNSRLGANALTILNDPHSRLYLPVIALAECCYAVGRGRTKIPSVASLLADVDADTRIVVVALDRAIVDESFRLIAISELHDLLIVKTLSQKTPKFKH
jgi:PIN domain nuclease of toxin-antitoxin system